MNVVPIREIKVASGASILLYNVLGSGAFSSVFDGAVKDCGDRVVVKAPRMGSSAPISVQVALLQHEASVIRAFAGRTAALPRLYAEDWHCDEEHPYICLRDRGISLSQLADNRTKDNRRAVAAVLREQAHAGLRAALVAGYCHADLRPENVVYIGDYPVGNFQIIDWGLSVPPQQLTHKHKGGKAFFANELVCAADTAEYPIIFKPEYDLESIEYICFAVVRGARNLKVPWASGGGGGSQYVNMRAAEVSSERPF